MRAKSLIQLLAKVWIDGSTISILNEDVLLSEWKPNMMMVKKEMDIAKEFNKGTNNSLIYKYFLS